MSTFWGPPFRIDGPRPVAPRYRLVDVATVVPEPDGHWRNGAQVWGYPPETPSTHNPCDTGTLRTKDADGTALIPEFASFTAYAAMTCTSRSFGDDWRTYRDRIVTWFEATESFAVEREFAQGVEVPTNPYLADPAVDLLAAGAAQTALESMALLENAIATTGRQGMIHADPATATAWASNHLTLQEGRYLRTWLGTPIVVGHGYVGTTPAGGGAAGADQGWAFVTGPVEIIRGELIVNPPTVAEALDRDSNDLTFYAERDYLVYWDTALQSAVLVDRSS